MTDLGENISLFKDGELERLGAELLVGNPSNILLVTGRSSFSASGASSLLDKVLVGKNITRVHDFDTNPKLEDVSRILSELEIKEKVDLIIAVGGGSVMDVAKLLKAFWNSEDPVRAYLDGNEEISAKDIPLIAIPTTAGSGSEATHFAVVYDGSMKHSVADPELLPTKVILLPSLIKSNPSSIIGSSGMDALCQGIESYWSIYSTEESREYAQKAISLVSENLKHTQNAESDDVWTNLLLGSFYAGKAINITKTTAPHAISYALTSFFGISHGYAVSLLLPSIFEYNEKVVEDDCLDGRGCAWVRERLQELEEMLGIYSGSIHAYFEDFHRVLGSEFDLKVYGVESERDIDTIVKNGFNPQRVNNNPRKLTEESLRDILNNLVK